MPYEGKEIERLRTRLLGAEPAAPDAPDLTKLDRPVVFADLFDGQPVESLRSAQAAEQVIGELPVRVSDNYAAFTAARLGAPWQGSPPAATTLREYLSARGDPLRVAVEQPTPKALGRLFRAPRIALPPDRDPGDLRSKIFLGRPGSFATLHYDADQRAVLLHQVFGEKHVVLIDPSATKFLTPRGNFSMLFLQNLSVDEKRRFLAFTGAHATTLAAGETLFIPALWWHYAEYASTSLAFNLRIARNAYNRFLGDEVAPDWRLQAFSRLLLRAPPDEQLEHAFARLRHVVRARHATLDAKHDAVSGLLTALCEDWVPQAVVSRYVHLAYDRWERANARLFYEARTTFGPDVHPARRSA